MARCTVLYLKAQKNDSMPPIMWKLRLTPLLLLVFAACRSRDPIVARVGRETITQSEFRHKLAEVTSSYQHYVITPNGRRQFLDILIREKMVLAVARASDVRRSPEYRSELERLKAEETERVREGSDYLLSRLWLDDLRKKGTLHVSDDEIQDYYRKYPTEVLMRHILMASPEEAQAIAKKVRQGANFSSLARDVSLDAETAADGGRMAPVIYGEIIPDLEDVVFHMRLGEIGGPIKSKFGYHILRKDSERRLAFRDARERIARLLEKQKLDQYLQSIQRKFPVEVVDEQFK